MLRAEAWQGFDSCDGKREESMEKSALDLISGDLQAVALSEKDVARAVAVASPTNQRVREAADARLQFEEEPAAFARFLRAAADKP